MSDSSSTDHNDPTNDNNNNDQFAPEITGHSNSIMLSDSDDRHSYAFAFRLRQTPTSGNFESDSLNENFSPSRPNIRRKRKFKRMAVEYETTPSTPHTLSHPIFPIHGAAKKRVLKHNQENFRSNLFFGKRKRRERFADYESYKHSSSVPRQRGGFLSQKDGGLSYLEYKSRNRASSMSTARGSSIEKILPLNKSIVSKIEKISNDSKINFNFTTLVPTHTGSRIQKIECAGILQNKKSSPHFQAFFGSANIHKFKSPVTNEMVTSTNFDDSKVNTQKIAQKSGSFESALPSNNNTLNKLEQKKKYKHFPITYHGTGTQSKHKQSRRLKLQFDDQNFMDCGNMNDFLSSSSLSSDSETEETNESDHEGDDELTDWPGHEVMVNFASKNEFRRANKKANKLPQIKQQDDVIQDDDTLMSSDEVPEKSSDTQLLSNTFEMHALKYEKTSHPINIVGGIGTTFVSGGSRVTNLVASGESRISFMTERRPIESEMSGETSNHFLSSPNIGPGEIREIRAGCRRIRDERPGFSIITSFNENLMKYALFLFYLCTLRNIL